MFCDHACGSVIDANDLLAWIVFVQTFVVKLKRNNLRLRSFLEMEMPL